MNELWRLNPKQLAGYTEDKALMHRIKRYYPTFTIYAEYYKKGELIAVVYAIPNEKKRSARHLFRVYVTPAYAA